MIVGIDLGTTNSSIAYMTDQGPKLIPNSLGKTLTPSAVGIDSDGTVLTGAAAKDYMVVHPGKGTTAFKRFMGTERKIPLDKEEFSPEQLSALILRSLKQDAEHYFGNANFQSVVTVPAYFNDAQRQATLNAAQIAELDVVRLINEPTAASIAYGFHESEESKNLLVLDLGGGTFDVSAVEMFEGVVDVRASFGDSFLGGEDFTHVIAAEILKSKEMKFEDAEFKYPLMVARLKYECEIAKIAISTQNNAKVRIPRLDGSFDDEQTADNTFTVWREQFEMWSAELLDRMRNPINRVMADAAWNTAQVDEIILVGGSTRMPMVHNMVEDQFHIAPRCRLNPDEVVAMGASIQGGLFEDNRALKDLAVTDIAPFTLGVEVSKEFGQSVKPGYMLPIIHRNRKIPSSQVKRVVTVYPDQDEIAVKVYQGEGRRVEQCTFLGEFNVTNLPKGEAGQEIDIRFSYDLNGVLEVEATVVATEQRTQHVITSHARGLTKSEIAESIQRLHQLKPTPRDKAQWTALLKQAERHYEQSTLNEREVMEPLMDFFEIAINSGDKEQINSAAKHLKSFMENGFDMFDDEDDNGFS